MKIREYNKLTKKLDKLNEFTVDELCNYITHRVRINQLVQTNMLLKYKELIDITEFKKFMSWMNCMGYMYYSVDFKFIGKSEDVYEYKLSCYKNG